MSRKGAPLILKLLSNDLRWNILTLLSQSDLRVQELTEKLQQPQNLVSYHLQKLHDASLIVEHHSTADGREIYYGINLKQIQELFIATEQNLHPGLVTVNDTRCTFPPLRILFLCTHNSARSQMAEGFLRLKSHNQLQVFSAGTDPFPVNPNAVQIMAEHQIDIRDQRSKSVDSLLDQQFDYVITVCDRARENCPTFPGKPVYIHWSIPDPVAQRDQDENQLLAFRTAAFELHERIGFLITRIANDITRR